jgi:RING-type zinc-finger/B-box zinc finger
MDSRIPRILPDCGHTFCTECLISLKAKQGSTLKCPEDNIFINLVKPPTEFPKNMVIIKHLEKALKEKKESEESKKMCPIHKKKRKIICLTCRDIICSKCAIFSIHKEHDLKMEDEMKKEITQRGEYLLELYNLIKQNEQIIKRDDIDANYMKFKDRVKELRTEIEKKFKDIYDAIKQKEVKLLDSLQAECDKLETKFNAMKEVPKQLSTKLLNWKNDAKNKLEKLPEIEKQIEIGFELLEDKDPANDVINMGVKLLEQLSAMKSDITIESITEVIGKFTVSIHPQLINIVSKCCHIKCADGEEKGEDLLEEINLSALLSNEA